jgi:hypothetical protein
MRTTLNIDADVLQTAREIARKERKSAGEVISELARRGFYAQDGTVAELVPPYTERNGVPVLPPTGSLVTNESVRKIRETEGI